MISRTISGLALAALMAAGTVAVLAQDFTPPATAEEAIAMREAAMRQNGGLLRGAANLSGDEAVAAAETFLFNYTHFPEMFPEGSSEGSDALPAIWENWETFTGIFETGRVAAEEALAAAQAGDSAAYGAAIQTIMGTCNQCHQQFRS
ncbi:MAG: cytochrome c [Devosia sp.]|uniref:cytochrome c n=1 Tax=Devosia sp. TaxID=1871048 RepID=UPI0024CC1595|nr:cytochrome c [Devosia sp.]UYN99752.1 MAG: cytochrome c [Devosia sp.]